mgnify:CR=1 FL=1
MTLLLLSGCATQSAEKPYRQITMEEAITMMEEETGYIILDVRTAQEYSEKHIPGAINIANESIGTEDISELPDKDQLILVYCRSGNRSKQASDTKNRLKYSFQSVFNAVPALHFRDDKVNIAKIRLVPITVSQLKCALHILIGDWYKIGHVPALHTAIA